VSTVLVQSSEVGGNGGLGVLLKVRNAGIQGEEFLRPAEVFESDLASFLLSGGPMGLLDEIITASSRDGSVRLIVRLVDEVQGWPELQATPAATVDHVWNA